MRKLIQFNTLYSRNNCPSLYMKDVVQHTLDDIKEFQYSSIPPEYWPAIQLFSSPERLSDINSHDEYWNYWTGCCFVDVDFKQLPPESIKYDIAYIQLCIGAELSNDKNIYAYQRSKSGNGLHYIFYYNVEKSRRSFDICAKVSQNRIMDALKKRVYDLYLVIKKHDMANAKKKVIDDCSLTPVQPLIMTGYPLFCGKHIGDCDFGELDISKLQLFEMTDNKIKSAGKIETFDNGLNPDGIIWSLNEIRWDCDYGDIVWNNQGCWRLAAFLCMIGVTYDVAHSIFYEMFKDGYVGRKSKWRTIEYEFNTTWKRAARGGYKLNNISNKYYDFAKNHLNIYQYEIPVGEKMTDQQRLDAYIASHEGDRWPYLPFVPDCTFNLLEGQYIGGPICSQQIENAMQDANTNQAYVKAGCGTGKTKYIIQQFLINKKAIIVCHLNSIKNYNYDSFLRDDDSVEYVKPTNAELTDLMKNGTKLPHHMLLGWPQFARLLSNARSKDLKDYQIYVDEAHAFQYDYTYRYDDISTIITNINKVDKLMLFSATPGAEHSVLLTDDKAICIEIEKPVQYTIQYYCVENQDTRHCGKIVDTIVNYIRSQYAIYPNDVYAVYDNRHHTDYDIFLENLSYVRLCREESQSEEIQKILQNQILGKRIIVSTAYGKEGIEFNDNIGNLVVIIPRYYDVTSHDAEQFINRFRHKKNVQVYFWEVNPWDDNIDIELIRKGRYLVSAQSAADDRLPDLLQDINNRYIKEVSKIDLAKLIGNKRYESILKLISYNFDDLLDNTIKTPKNLYRMYPGIITLQRVYDAFDCDRSNYDNEKKVLSNRACVEKYIDIPYIINEMVMQMKQDGLLTDKAESKEERDETQRIEQMFTLDDLFVVSNDTPNSFSVLNRDDKRRVNFVRKTVELIKDIIRLLDNIEKDGEVSISEKTWCYLRLWKNNNGIINYRKALKFAIEYRDDERGAAVSQR